MGASSTDDDGDGFWNVMTSLERRLDGMRIPGKPLGSAAEVAAAVAAAKAARCNRVQEASPNISLRSGGSQDRVQEASPNISKRSGGSQEHQQAGQNHGTIRGPLSRRVSTIPVTLFSGQLSSTKSGASGRSTSETQTSISTSTTAHMGSNDTGSNSDASTDLDPVCHTKDDIGSGFQDGMSHGHRKRSKIAVPQIETESLSATVTPRNGTCSHCTSPSKTLRFGVEVNGGSSPARAEPVSFLESRENSFNHEPARGSYLENRRGFQRESLFASKSAGSSPCKSAADSVYRKLEFSGLFGKKDTKPDASKSILSDHKMSRSRSCGSKSAADSVYRKLEFLEFSGLLGKNNTKPDASKSTPLMSQSPSHGSNSAADPVCRKLDFSGLLEKNDAKPDTSTFTFSERVKMSRSRSCGRMSAADSLSRKLEFSGLLGKNDTKPDASKSTLEERMKVSQSASSQILTDALSSSDDRGMGNASADSVGFTEATGDTLMSLDSNLGAIFWRQMTKSGTTQECPESVQKPMPSSGSADLGFTSAYDTMLRETSATPSQDSQPPAMAAPAEASELLGGTIKLPGAFAATGKDACERIEALKAKLQAAPFSPRATASSLLPPAGTFGSSIGTSSLKPSTQPGGGEPQDGKGMGKSKSSAAITALQQVSSLASERANLQGQLSKAEVDMERMARNMDQMRRRHEMQIAMLRQEKEDLQEALEKHHTVELEGMRLEVSHAFKENHRLHQECGRLGQEVKKRPPATAEGLAPVIARLEMEALRDADPEVRSQLKRRLQLKWHPDKCINEELAKCVMQELQECAEWNS